MWLGDAASDTAFVSSERMLAERQIDFDIINQDALATDLKAGPGTLETLSGNQFRTVIIPSASILSQAELDRLKAFAQAGGKVVFLGDAPRLVMDKNFLTATGPADISWAVAEPSGEVTAKVLAALPAPDVALDQATTGLKYNHRRLKDADVYFLFNEGDTPLNLKATLATTGTAKHAQSWDAHTGRMESLSGATFGNGKATLPVELEPWATTLVVISSAPSKLAANE